MILRLAETLDSDEIAGIVRQTPWEKTDYLQRQLRQGNIVVAKHQVGVIGFIAWNREFFSFPFVWLVVTSMPHRRTGVASSLFAYVEQQCKGSRLYTSTNESHAAMHSFLARRGYRRAGTADVDPGDPEILYRIDL